MRTERVPVADGIELVADRWAPASRGSDAAFVLVHGLASNARLWDGVAGSLTALGHPVVTIDLRGHGRSSKPDAGYDVPAVAEDLANLIESLGLDCPIVVGQSWGGNVVLELAARERAQLRAIACIDGGWLEPRSAYPTWAACRAALAPPRLVGRRAVEIEGYIRSAHPDWPETGIRGTLANFEIRPDGTIAPWLTYERHIQVLHGLWDHRPSERYPAIGVPVLLVPAETGRDDRHGRKAGLVEAAAAAIPRASTIWFVGDHDLHAQHPDELATVLHAELGDGSVS